MSNQGQSVIFLMGPTASGKTDLAVSLVERYNCEIISVDSALIYKGMDIGTAKPDRTILAKAPHRLIDILDPKDAYSAADFCQDAHLAIEEILAKGKVPLLVGGTMLYFKALKDGLSPLPSADETIREVIAKEAEEQGWGQMHQQLLQVDPESGKRIHPNDPQRIGRALEIYRVTGQTMTSWLKQDSKPLLYNIRAMAITPEDRVVLHERIALRFHKMMDEGFMDEVKFLYERGDLNPNMPSIRCVGYRQVWSHLAGELNYDEMVERGIIATRQLAKRQLTWLRSWPDLTWFDSMSPKLLEKVCAWLHQK